MAARIAEAVEEFLVREEQIGRQRRVTLDTHGVF